MHQYRTTKFDWITGKIKLGSEWIYLATTKEKEINYKIDKGNVSHEQSNQIENLVQKYSGVFASNPKAPKQCIGVKHKILSDNDRVSRDKIRRIPSKWQKDIDTQIDEMLQNEIIQHSNSPYNSNPILDTKKDGSKRFVVDFRSLNKSTTQDTYPLPNVDDLLEKCRGGKFFTQLDLAAGYWGVAIHPDDRKKTAFSVPRGKFEFLRMPFGLKNAQSTFQRLMDSIVHNLRRKGHKGIDAYVDNIIIVSERFNEHLIALEAVLMELKSHNLSLRADKCELAFACIEFLGYIIDGNSIKASPDNVKKLERFPTPSNKKQLQRFLGLANFNRRFVKDFAELTKPLTSLLSDKAEFKWQQTEEDAFNELKLRLTESTGLTLPNWNKPFHIQTDASKIATGAMLFQMDDDNRPRPIAYHSRTLNKTQGHWSATERELFGIIDASRKWNVYCSNHIIFHTDHEPLQNIRKQKDPRGKIGRWLLELEGIDYRIRYIPGKENASADCLSRAEFNSIANDILYENKLADQMYTLYTGELDKVNIKKLQKSSKTIKNAIRQLGQKGKISYGPYRRYRGIRMDGEVLWKGNRIIVPPEAATTIINEYHGQAHPGAEATYEIIKTRYWWKGMAGQIENFVSSCRTCAQAKDRPAVKAPMQMVEMPAPREKISMDIGSMPTSPRGNGCFLLVVDLCTKFITATALPNQTAPLLEAALWNKWLAIFGIPSSLLSDQGKMLTEQ